MEALLLLLQAIKKEILGEDDDDDPGDDDDDDDDESDDEEGGAAGQGGAPGAGPIQARHQFGQRSESVKGQAKTSQPHTVPPLAQASRCRSGCANTLCGQLARPYAVSSDRRLTTRQIGAFDAGAELGPLTALGPRVTP